jgi:hypothetical protein
MQLRMTLAEIGMPTISSLLPASGLGDKLVSPEGVDQSGWLSDATDKFLSELAWWARAAKRETAASGPPF